MDKLKMLGKYRLLEKLGSGGFATVYKAENTSLGNQVALKLMDTRLFEDEPTVVRFRQEARLVVQLDHPNIVRVLDMEEVANQFFIVMEYVPGQSLQQFLAGNGLLPLEQIVDITRQVAAALDYAHSHRLIHRDIKPSNIMIRPDGVVKLMDFGIVKAVEGTQITQTGTTIGTPAYMSPEQTLATPGTPVDHRSDLYSLGVIVYEMISGRIPFDGDTPLAIVYKHVHETPPVASTIAPRAKGPLDQVLQKALAKKAEDRFQSGAELGRALAQAVQELQENLLTTAYRKATGLLEKRQYAAALVELEELEAIHPAYRDVRDLITQAQQGTQLEDIYEEAASHFARGRELAQKITATNPAFADPAHILLPAGSKPAANTNLPWITRVMDWLTAMGATFILASYSGHWGKSRDQDVWETGLSTLWDATIGNKSSDAWVPRHIWFPLLGLLLIGLFLLLPIVVPRLTRMATLTKGFLATVALILYVYMNNMADSFTSRSTGPYVMLTGLVALWLGTVLVPGVVYLWSRSKQP